MEYSDGTVARAADGTALPVGPILYAAHRLAPLNSAPLPVLSNLR